MIGVRKHGLEDFILFFYYFSWTFHISFRVYILGLGDFPTKRRQMKIMCKTRPWLLFSLYTRYQSIRDGKRGSSDPTTPVTRSRVVVNRWRRRWTRRWWRTLGPAAVRAAVHRVHVESLALVRRPLLWPEWYAVALIVLVLQLEADWRLGAEIVVREGKVLELR